MLTSTGLDKRRHSITRLFALVRPHLKICVVGLLSLALGSSINLLFPEIIRRLLNKDFWFILESYAFETALGLIFLFVLQAICFYYRSLLFNLMGLRIVADLRRKVYSSLIARDIEFFDRNTVADLVSRLSSDTLMVQDALSIKMSVFIRYGFQVIFGILLMALISWKLTCLIILSVPLIVLTSRSLAKRLRFWSKEQQRELAYSANVASEGLSQIRVVKAFAQENYEAERYSAAVGRVLKNGVERSQIAAFFSSFVSLLLNASLVGLLFYGLLLVKHGNLTAGDLTAFVLYGTIVAVSFAFVVNGISEFIQALGASERIFEFLKDEKYDLADTKSDTLINLEKISGQIEFKNITFAYPSRSEIAVLKDISFTIESHSVTALVGPSGAGKSSIVALILKFYRAQSGEILLDGRDINQISDYSLRRLIAYVPQEPQLFASSIAENLRYASPNASVDEIENACAQANMLEFIKTLPNGINTEVGERGVQLSAGQRQRLSIARALLKDPQLLILDEATSALDSENEYLVQLALEKLMRGRTTLVIAHRLSTVKNANRLIVIDHGQIVQTGTHDSLLQSQGLYRQLVERQELVADMLQQGA